MIGIKAEGRWQVFFYVNNSEHRLVELKNDSSAVGTKLSLTYGDFEECVRFGRTTVPA